MVLGDAGGDVEEVASTLVAVALGIPLVEIDAEQILTCTGADSVKLTGVRSA